MDVPKARPRTTHRVVIADDVRAELDAWEQKYGVPSDRLLDAFRDPVTGELIETDDFHAWDQAYEFWLAINPAEGVPTPCALSR